jgi:hypothetical protein
MATKIQLRRDTAANWTSVNPTLSQGELGYETDTDKVKVGDGSTTWTGLGYLIDGVSGAGGIALTDLSVTNDTTPLQGGSLSYDNTTGVFTYVPADVPTDTNDLTNGAGYITGADIAGAVTGAATIEDLVGALEGLGV